MLESVCAGCSTNSWLEGYIGGKIQNKQANKWIKIKLEKKTAMRRNKELFLWKILLKNNAKINN